MNDKWSKAIREYREDLDESDRRRAQMFTGFVIWTLIIGGMTLVGVAVLLLAKLLAG